MTDDDAVPFIYGDSFGNIETEVLGEMGGTITRRMEIPRRLATDLYDELDEELHERPDTYLVVVSADTGFAELANVCVVEANSEREARQKVDDMDEPQNYGTYHVYEIDDLRDRMPFSFFR